MREIQCKAKVKDWKEKPTDEQWIYGYYVQGLNMYEEPIHIIFDPTTMFFSHGETDGWEEIDPDTLCKCTGLTDKNENKIWENDIVKGLFYHGLKVKAVVAFKYGVFGLKWNRGDVEEFSAFTSICNVEYEIIGNIFDNPELLKGGAE